MDWRTTPADKAEGALKSNPFEGFEAYANPTVAPPAEDEAAEGDEGPRGFSGGSVPTDNYETA